MDISSVQMVSQVSRVGVFALAAALTACGGGDDRATPLTAGQVVVSDASSGRAKALAISAMSNPTAADLFDWAQWKWPDLFPANPVQVDKELAGQTFRIRAYASGIFLAVGLTGGEVYALLPIPGSDLKSLGTIANFAGEISADACTFRPGSCEPPQAGAYNQCVDPAVMSLPTGFSTRLVYDYVGEMTGEQTVESLIEGPDTFQGQNVVRLKSTTSGSNTTQGFTIDTMTEVQTYLQINTNGLQDLLGSFAKVSSGGGVVNGFPIPTTVTEVRTVFNPALTNVEFTLQPGQSVTRTTTATSTVLAGPGAGAPIASSTTEVHTFVATEAVTVLGRSYETCRYTSHGGPGTEVLTTWFLQGRGIPVKIESVGQLVQLKSGTYNGAPL